MPCSPLFAACSHSAFSAALLILQVLFTLLPQSLHHLTLKKKPQDFAATEVMNSSCSNKHSDMEKKTTKDQKNLSSVKLWKSTGMYYGVADIHGRFVSSTYLIFQVPASQNYFNPTPQDDSTTSSALLPSVLSTLSAVLCFGPYAAT